MSNSLTLNGYQRISAALSEFSISLANANISQKSAFKRLENDSRNIQQGDIFCALQGHALDGRLYIDKAINQGAALVIAQCQSPTKHGNISFHPRSSEESSPDTNVAIIEFYQLDQQLFDLASAYYQQPQKAMKIIGITGTNGKTTTSQIIASLYQAHQQNCAVIGTVGAGLIDDLTPIANTTPGATELLGWLSQFSQQKISHVAMEVSSHALAQKRVHNELFDVSIFTNLSRDHLDYHHNMAEYAAAKHKVFSGQATQVAIINGDDAQGQQWLAQGFKAQPVIVYGRSKAIKTHQQYVYAEQISHHHQGVTFKLSSHLGSCEITSQLLGDFNVDNLLAGIATMLADNIALADIAHSAAQIKPIAGRMEAFHANGKATAVVDYAHTPDALVNALQACRQHCQGALWVVFGCGGNRDKGKRALMGEIAERLAEQVIITSDNPRNEAPEAIANDILSGCKDSEKITVMLDRQQAVLSALAQAQPHDVILLAGKGHENYIIINDEKLPYDERALVRSAYQNEVVL